MVFKLIEGNDDYFFKIVRDMVVLTYTYLFCFFSNLTKYWDDIAIWIWTIYKYQSCQTDQDFSDEEKPTTK